jgi:hypothetical protein
LPKEEILTVLKCRASKLAVEKGFKDWKATQFSLTSSNSPQEPLMVAQYKVQLLEEPLPREAPVKNWCADA